MKVRIATAHDYEALCRLRAAHVAEDVQSGAVPREAITPGTGLVRAGQLIQSLTAGHSDVYLVEDAENKAVGYAILSAGNVWGIYPEPSAHVALAYVLPECRVEHSAASTLLFRAVARRCRELKLKRVQWIASAKSATLRMLYARHSLRPVAQVYEWEVPQDGRESSRHCDSESERREKVCVRPS